VGWLGEEEEEEEGGEEGEGEDGEVEGGRSPTALHPSFWVGHLCVFRGERAIDWVSKCND